MLHIISVTRNDLIGIINTIKSTYLLRSKYNVIQVIVDGSDEALSKEVLRIAKREKNVKYIRQKHGGIAAAFNLGIKYIDDGLIWFLNGGDELLSDLDVVSFIKIISSNSADITIFQIKQKSGKIISHPPIWKRWPPIISWVPHPATIINKRVFNEIGFFNESLTIAMDYEFWFRSFSRKVIVDTISIPIVLFDMSGVSNVNYSRMSREVIYILTGNIFNILIIVLKRLYLFIKTLLTHIKWVLF